MRFTDNHEEMYPELNNIEDLNLLLETYSTAECITAETCMSLDSSKLWCDRISKKVIKKYQKVEILFIVVCPCCDKGMTSEESLKFDNNIDDLFKSNLATDELISRSSEMYVGVKEINKYKNFIISLNC